MVKRLFQVAMLLLCITLLTTFMPAAASLAADDVIELSFSHTIPPVVPLAKVYEGWAKQIEERSKGRVKINFYWSESLLKASEFYRGVQTGQTDITYYVLGLDYGLMPLNMYNKLAFLGYPSKEVGTEIYKKMLAEFPELQAEFKGVKVLAVRMGPAYHLHFTDKKVRVPEDIKGMKLISVGGSMAKEMVQMKAAPLDVKVGDLYMSLERKLAEGMSSHIPILHAFGVLDLLKNHLIFEGGAAMGPDMLLFNEESWNKLPPDVQKIIEDLDPWLTETLIKADNGYEAMVMGKIKEMGHDVVTPTPEELQKWKEAVQPVHDNWIKETEAKGLPAQKIYDEVKKLIKEYDNK